MNTRSSLTDVYRQRYYKTDNTSGGGTFFIDIFISRAGWNVYRVMRLV